VAVLVCGTYKTYSTRIVIPVDAVPPESSRTKLTTAREQDLQECCPLRVGLDSDDHLPEGTASTKVFTFSRERISYRGLLSLSILLSHTLFNCSCAISTEEQGISFVGYTWVECGRPGLWNLRNLCPVLYVYFRSLTELCGTGIVSY